jgi:hypothetical protein
MKNVLQEGWNEEFLSKIGPHFHLILIKFALSVTGPTGNRRSCEVTP